MRTKRGDRRKSPKTYPREGMARIQEAAEFLNCERSTVYAMIDKEILRTVPLVSEMRVPWKALWAHHDDRPELISISDFDDLLRRIETIVCRLADVANDKQRDERRNERCD